MIQSHKIVTATPNLSDLLRTAEGYHNRLCPRQVLGMRLGLLGGKILGIPLPQHDKQLLIIAELDGCGVSGISIATGCTVGHRTLRIVDYGKMAATFIDTKTEQAVRITPQPNIRQLAQEVAPDQPSRWHAQLLGYQRIPDDQLLRAQTVQLNTKVSDIISRAGHRVSCDTCNEEIINQREIVRDGQTLCQSCAGNGYYQLREQSI